ncbi:MAG: hypothetical protein HYY25_06700 [Candidatus Wallbacteria bacterium]|nr:hypothetical protein [Candidatus Wallbacteria bacterium]
MIKKVTLTPADGHVFGNPAPLGLLGLTIACFALAPISLGLVATRESLVSAAVCALLFGCGCQLLTGLMDFANKNVFGGTIFTTFGFMWAKNAWELYMLSTGFVPSAEINFTLDVLLLVVFAVLAYGFGFFSLTLFVFLMDINLIYVLKIVKHVGHLPVLDKPIGLLLALLGVIALWITFASLINPVTGRMTFLVTGPVFQRAPASAGFDFSTRHAIFSVLYEQWRRNAFDPMPAEELTSRIQSRGVLSDIVPNLFYLWEYGCLVLDFADQERRTIKSARLNAAGIDLYEQLVLKKYEF